jgi:hypothetical protein
MASQSGQQAAFTHSPSHPQVDFKTCPTCGQEIPPDKLEEIGGRIAAKEREQTLMITAQLEKEYAIERARADAKAKTDLESERQQSAIREVRVRDEAQKATEKLFTEKLAEAEQARADLMARSQQQLAEAESARRSAEQMWANLQAEMNELRTNNASAIAAIKAEAKKREDEIRNEATRAAESAAAERIAAIEAAQRESEAEINARIAQAEEIRIASESAIAEANAKAHEAEVKLLTLTDQHASAMEANLKVQREALEKAKDEAVNAEKARAFDENQKLSNKVTDLQRALDNKTAEELGEGAEVNLFEVLRKEFPDDDIRRTLRGAQGADILHVVMLSGKKCGTIIYDSKNHNQFRNEHVSKLRADQLAAGAEHAILSTSKLPQGTRQLHLQDGVILANPARVVVVATIIRQHLVQLHSQRVSEIERESKTAALYAFIVSERCSSLLARIDERAEDLLDQQGKEIRWHQNNWKRQGETIRAIQKAKADLENQVNLIIGTSEGNAAA